MVTAHSGPLTVIGAGVAGLAAAIVARKAGREVVVYERNREVGGRFHGDFQGLENWSSSTDVLEELAGLGIEPSFNAVPVRQQVCYGPDGKEYVIRSAHPFYYLVSRGPGPGTLDHSLKEQALAAGAEIRFGEIVRDPPGGSIVAWGPHHADAVAVGYLFETDLADGGFAVLDDRLSPGGYAYLLVHAGQATLATCLFQDFRNHAVYLHRAGEYFHQKLGFSMRNARRFSGVGNLYCAPPATSEQVFWAGEAAGLQDALWGFGIRFAILSGSHGAACSARDASPHRLHRMWRRTVGRQVRASVVNRYFFERLGKAGYGLLLRRLAQSPQPLRTLQRLYATSPFKRAVFPFVHRRTAGPAAKAARPAKVAAPAPQPLPLTYGLRKPR